MKVIYRLCALYLVLAISLCSVFFGAGDVKAAEGRLDIASTANLIIKPYSIAGGDATMTEARINRSEFLIASGDWAGTYACLLYTNPWGNALKNTSLGLDVAPGSAVFCIEMEVPLIGYVGEVVAGAIGSSDYIKGKTNSTIADKGRLYQMVCTVLSVIDPEVSRYTSSDILNSPVKAAKYFAAQFLIWQIMEGDISTNWFVVGSYTNSVCGYQSMPAWSSPVSGGSSIKSYYDSFLSKCKNASASDVIYECVPIMATSESNSGRVRQTTIYRTTIVAVPPVGTVKLVKSSSNPSVTNGNSSYDYNGVQFRLIDKATNGQTYNKVGTVVNGEITWTDVPPGDYIVSEVGN